jgi:hypothetical protein
VSARPAILGLSSKVQKGVFQMDRKDHQVYDLIRRPEDLPELRIPSRYLSKPLAQMEYTALVSRCAMDIGSSAHLYAVWKLLSTVEQAERLREIYGARGMPPQVEASYHKLTEEYMALIQTIPRQVGARLLVELQQIPDLEREGWLSRLLDLLTGRC